MYEAQLAKEWEFIVNDCERRRRSSSRPTTIDEKCKELPREGARRSSTSSASTRPEERPHELVRGARSRRARRTPSPSITPEPEGHRRASSTRRGTTGNPKGVILSHGNIASNVSAVHEIFPIDGDDRSALVPAVGALVRPDLRAPRAALDGRVASRSCESVDKIVDNLAEVQPDDALQRAAHLQPHLRRRAEADGGRSPARSRALFHDGARAPRRSSASGDESLGSARSSRSRSPTSSSSRRSARRFGGRLKYAFSGGAALSTRGRRVHRRASASRSTRATASPRRARSRRRTAPATARSAASARPIPGVKIVIDKTSTGDPKHGEIVVYGPNVMQGYHNRPEENDAVFTAGRRLPHRRHRATSTTTASSTSPAASRSSTSSRTASTSCPTPLEEQLKLSPYILNVMVYGDNRRYNVALVVVDVDAVKKWAEPSRASRRRRRRAAAKTRACKELVKAEIEKHSARVQGLREGPEGHAHRRGLHDRKRHAHADPQGEAPRRLAEVRPADRGALRRRKEGQGERTSSLVSRRRSAPAPRLTLPKTPPTLRAMRTFSRTAQLAGAALALVGCAKNTAPATSPAPVIVVGEAAKPADPKDKPKAEAEEGTRAKKPSKKPPSSG